MQFPVKSATKSPHRLLGTTLSSSVPTYIQYPLSLKHCNYFSLYLQSFVWSSMAAIESAKDSTLRYAFGNVLAFLILVLIGVLAFSIRIFSVRTFDLRFYIRIYVFVFVKVRSDLNCFQIQLL